MYLIRDKNLFSGLSPAVVAKVAALSIVLVLSGQTKAQSQSDTLMDYSHPNVTVDLSVISSGGYNQPANSGSGVLPSLFNRKLLLPGDQAPRSMLHVPAASGAPVVQAKKPAKSKAAPKRAAAKPATPVSVAAVAPARKSPPPAAKVAPPAKVAPLRPVTTAKTPKKLQPPAQQAITAPVVKPAPKVAKKKAPKAPTPPAIPAAKKAPTKQQASIPPAAAQAEFGKKHRVSFAPDQTKLPASAKTPLIALAASLKGQDNMRLQLMAYAGGPSLSSSRARRMSLSRALAIRSFLIENGVRSTRIDVRALGNKTTEKPLNRVDLNVTER
jgi:outer membrane protein OmpA-like peptidoglycan-associated protein